jgi:23S rRNA (adenine2503-C2)-methyltransferase
LTRHLDAWEMVEQVLRVRREPLDRPVTGVVFQGQGEPLHNYDAVIRAAAILRDPSGGRIGSDRITISTVGLPAAIRRYTDEGHPYRLILSLVSAWDERRASLIPPARRHSVAELAAAIRRHAERRRSLVHLGWVMLSGINTGADEAAELARLFRGVRVRLSLIDVNDPSGRFAPPSDPERKAFMSALGDHGLAFVRRYSGGGEIAAACGTLASTARGGQALPRPS